MDECHFNGQREIAPGAYPPDGEPFLPIESLAAGYGQMLGFGPPPKLHALHLAAMAVLMGVVSKQEAADTVKAAYDRTTDPVGRVVELRRLLNAYFARAGNLEVFSITLPCDFSGLEPKHPSLSAGVVLLARRICEGLDGRGDVLFQAATVAAIAVESGRLDVASLWGLVAEARRMSSQPRLAFHSLVYWIERLYLLSERRTAPAAPTPNTVQDVEQLYRWLEPSAN